jgi:hypothetical protein
MRDIIERLFGPKRALPRHGTEIRDRTPRLDLA